MTVVQTALLLIDLQKDFFDPRSVGTMAKATCLPGIRRILDHARNHRWKVIHVQTLHPSPQSIPLHLRNLNVPAYCQDGTAGVESLLGIRHDDESVVTKTGYSAFTRTGLENQIYNCSSIVVVGLASDCCVLHTAFDAATICNKEVFVPYQAVAASSLESYIHSLSMISKSAAAIVDLRDLTQAETPSWAMRISGNLEDRLRKDRSEAFSIASKFQEYVELQVKESRNPEFLVEDLVKELEQELSERSGF